MSRWFSSIQLAAISTLLIIFAVLSSCSDLKDDEDSFRLSATVRGLAENETIIVFNGSSIQITGTKDLFWTEPQTFSHSYSESKPDYNVQITRQPSNSSKMCRVINPSGVASKVNAMIRIECGFPVVVADINGTTTDNNGLKISNGLQTVTVNGTTTIVTGLQHDVIQDPLSDDPNDKILQITPEATIGGVFEELYLEGDPISLTFSSTNQGCEMTGANDNSSFNFFIPGADSLVDTVQTIPFAKDWIDNESAYGTGRTCASFEAGTVYQIGYAPGEKPKGESNYDVNCYPMDPIEIICGHSLKVKVNGLDESITEFITLTATRNSSITHSINIYTNFTSNSQSRGLQTFNLAFEDEDTYLIELENEGDLAPKTCSFDSSGINETSGTINDTIVEVLRCD